MPSVTVTDLMEEATYAGDAGGVTAVRKFLITGLNEVSHKKLYQAALLPGVPQRGQAHPGIPNLVVDSFDCVPAPDSPTKAYITITYRTPTADNTTPSESAPCELSLGAVLVGAQRDLDNTGAVMVLTATNKPPQNFIAEVQQAMPYLRLSRREPAPFNKSKVTTNVGAVNSTPWFGDPARTWLCANIDATLDGDAFRVRYEFQYNRFTWDVRGVYKDVDDNLIASSEKYFKVYSEADFNALGLGV